ncbi:DUF992 domain-containing protein [Bradyrhizobium sp. SYSU BS000235]|uniref:DUF992 domain-containing protein n=1 Tax=Bradyrhizobium sp. SYSU BS000235 TaxID=3411332 RepID=UPI003C73E2AF
MRRASLLGALGAVVLGCATTSPADAQLFRAGRLLCFSSARVGLIVGSTQSLRCEFHATTGQRYIYTGRIRRVGLDIGATAGGVLSWLVLSKNSRIGPGTLRGTYIGAGGSVAFGPGLGANVLIGGSRRSVALQPISIERNIGVNLAAGVTRLTLGPRGRR